MDTADVIAEETRPLKEEKESRKSYLNMSAREAETIMQQAVCNREIKEDNFVTLLDDSGKMYRRYDDGRVEYVLI